jgi:hypothetical protein
MNQQHMQPKTHIICDFDNYLIRGSRLCLRTLFILACEHHIYGNHFHDGYLGQPQKSTSSITSCLTNYASKKTRAHFSGPTTTALLYIHSCVFLHLKI